MKIKSVLLAFFIAALIIILLVPVSPVVAYILYGLEFAFPLVMVGFGIYAARKKKIPNIFTHLIFFFTIYSLTLSVATVKYLFMFKTKIEEIPLISSIVDDILISSPIAGYLLFAVGLYLFIFTFFRLKHNNEESLTKSINFLRLTIEMVFLLFFITIVCCWAIGISELKLTYIEAFTFYFPYICTQFSIHFVTIVMAGVGIDLVKGINKDSKINLYS